MADLTNYDLTDYRTWVLGDEARQGVNIKRLGILRPRELDLVDAVAQFQDPRNDPGQGEWVAMHGIKLLDFIPGIREVVFAQNLTHDIGFYGVDPNAWKRLVAKTQDTSKLSDAAIRMPHQIKGKLMALRIFQKVGYPPVEYHSEIANNIGDHDTRLNETTPSGRILWASDYTWRVSYPCLKIYQDVMLEKEADRVVEAQRQELKQVSARPLEELFLLESEKSALECNPPFNLESPEYEIARLEFANTMFFNFGVEVAKRVLLPKYRKELEKVVEFYR